MVTFQDFRISEFQELGNWRSHGIIRMMASRGIFGTLKTKRGKADYQTLGILKEREGFLKFDGNFSGFPNFRKKGRGHIKEMLARRWAI